MISKGDKPAFADYMIWPWLERLEVMKLVKGLKYDECSNLPGYIERMKQLPAVKATYIKPESHAKFYKSYMAGEADYDMPLD